MNGSKPCGPLGGFHAPSPKRRRPRLRLSRSPSPQPSPEGAGETFGRAVVIRSSLGVVCLRNEGQRRGDCKRDSRIFLHRANALPLLGERVGVRGNEANSNPRPPTIPGAIKLRDSVGRTGGFPIWLCITFLTAVVRPAIATPRKKQCSPTPAG